MSGRVVHKFPIPDNGELELQVPVTAEVVHFGIQRNTFCAWIDRPAGDDEDLVPIQLLIRGTGHETPDSDWLHVGTAITEGGTFVFHLYQRARA
jgi:hypothetical protein